MRALRPLLTRVQYLQRRIRVPFLAGAHSHIRGLGLDDTLEPRQVIWADTPTALCVGWRLLRGEVLCGRGTDNVVTHLFLLAYRVCTPDILYRFL